MIGIQAARVVGAAWCRRFMLVFVLAVVGVGLVASVAFAAEPFGVRDFSMVATNRDGSPDVQAGSHPYQLTTSFRLSGPEVGSQLGSLEELFLGENLKDTRVELPPGLVGDPEATPRCSYETFIGGNYDCPADTAVGYETAYVRNDSSNAGTVGVIYTTNPIYNVVPPPGVAAEFAFLVKGLVPVFLDVSVRTGGDYGLTVNTRDITEIEEVYGIDATFWGVPEDPSHEALRGQCLKEEAVAAAPYPAVPESRGDCPVTAPGRPLLVNPTSCGVSREAAISVDSWQHPGVFTPRVMTALPSLEGCEKLPFSPSVTVTPGETAGSSPVALSADVRQPQESYTNPAGLIQANVKDVAVTLPAGVDLSPSAANGLLACSQAQLGLHDAEPAACPEASKVANVQITTPALPEPVLGSAYVAEQGNLPGNGENPFGSLTALYVVAEDKQAGVLVKLAGEVKPNPSTGQLETIFTETPQLPFSEVKLSFYGGPGAAVTTPATCGSYTSNATLTPWSGAASVSSASSFQITSGPHGTPCQDPLPFTPGFTAGTTNVQAAAFTPFTLTITRPDGDQALGGTQVTMPPGLLGMISSVTQCPEPQATQGTCGPESQIGETTVNAGLGTSPVTPPNGRVYLTGPYKGAPFGLSIVDPATAGPFNLGPAGEPIVTRARIEVNPYSGQPTITSDPLPTALQGVPLQLQRINVTINRPHFIFNPTNCRPLTLTGTISSDLNAVSVGVSSPFQAANCASAAVRAEADGDRRRSRQQSQWRELRREARIPGLGQANIHKVDLQLPVALPSRLTTLQKACLAATFESNPASCGPESVIGHATIHTPVLNSPLTGPAYLVSHGGAAFPDVEFVLQGENVTLILDGKTDIKNGITYSKFETAPDAPFTTFETELPAGPHSDPRRLHPQNAV